MLVRILLAVILAALPALSAVRPAAACTCGPEEVSDKLDRAEIVFIGSVASTTEVIHPAPDSRHDIAELAHVFDIESVFKGQIEQHSEILAPAHSGFCALPAAVSSGARVAIFVRADEQKLLNSNLCSFAGADELLEFVGDSGYPPIPVSIPTNQDAENTQRDSLTARSADENEDRRSGQTGRNLGFSIAIGALAAIMVGYALWRKMLSSRGRT